MSNLDLEGLFDETASPPPAVAQHHQVPRKRRRIHIPMPPASVAVAENRRQPAKASLLTPQEHAVVNALADAWNAFLQLEQLHSTDNTEFMHAIHAAQILVMSRPVQREFNQEIAKPANPQEP